MPARRRKETEVVVEEVLRAYVGRAIADGVGQLPHHRRVVHRPKIGVGREARPEEDARGEGARRLRGQAPERDAIRRGIVEELRFAGVSGCRAEGVGADALGDDEDHVGAVRRRREWGKWIGLAGVEIPAARPSLPVTPSWMACMTPWMKQVSGGAA